MSGDHNMYQKTKSYLDDFECPRCGHCCRIEEEHTNTLRQAAQRAVEVMNAHMMRADTDEFYEAKEALRQALEKNT
jgi:D-alanine-D-alanine ligase-like ATP-grasp enzyme